MPCESLQGLSVEAGALSADFINTAALLSNALPHEPSFDLLLHSAEVHGCR